MMTTSSSASPGIPLTEEDLHDLYAWVDEMPLSRPKRNIARDFSDGLCVAEITRFYFPKLVELHNYTPTNSKKQKLDNWKTLNFRVFRKLHFIVPEEEMNDIVDSVPGAIERFLRALRMKISQVKARSEEILQQQQRQGYQPTPTQLRSSGGAVGRPASSSDRGGPQSRASPGPQRAAQVQRTRGTGTRGASGASHAPASSRQRSSEIDNGESPHAASLGNRDGSLEGGLRVLLSEKDRVIFELRETVNLLNEKVAKLEELLRLKDADLKAYQKRYEK